MLALDLQPYSCVENRGFKELMNHMEPLYKIPSCTTFSRTIIPELYRDTVMAVKERMLADFQEGVESISLTTDMWTSRSNQSYISLICHYLTSNFEMRSFAMENRSVTESHTACNILEHLQAMMDNWELPLQKVPVCVVTDNARNFRAALRGISCVPMQCMGHTLQLAIKDAKEETAGVFAILKKCHAIVGYYKHSAQAAARLKDCQRRMELSVLELIQDVETRWNSEHYMLSHLVQLKEAICLELATSETTVPNLAPQEWKASWSHSERLVALDQLIEGCEPGQVRHMMNVIEPQFQRDFISLLPKELALYVLSFLEPRDLLRAAQTCHYWRILAEDNLLWREKCREAGLDDVQEVLGRRLSSCSVSPPSPSSVAPIPWKLAFMRHHYVEMNWRCKPIREPKVLRGHEDHVITCLQFSGNRIVSGSDDNTLKVWSATSGRCLRTLIGHTGGVWSSQMAGSLVVSGSTDRTLRVWNADTGMCLHTLYGHTSTVRCMHLYGNKVVSGSRDATLRVWDLETGECLHVLVGHVAAVRCVQYNGRLVVSGAYDYMVKVWDPRREECLHTLQGHTNRVYSLQFDGVHVVSGSLDTSIRVWDVETGACRHQLMGHQSLTSGMELRNNILVSGNADSTVKVWDIVTGQCLQTLAGAHKHQSAVTCLQFNSKFVVTSSDDGTVKLWDLRTGEFLRNLVALESGGSGGVVWRLRASSTKLVCAVGSRNGTEETKLLVLDFDEPK
ncbi:hypothetical protein HPB52_011713 [Rhipicephalus sanguineus]|uniref:F-box domain-containing protein n=1 Tax=Rhipicephalus sanguineus TaxID=34632 RepID=A0A9D4T3L1_RHISA|nr:hypothetical protein HPB52_011713 [Rhipicephalus sanguineus]